MEGPIERLWKKISNLGLNAIELNTDTAPIFFFKQA